MDHTQKPSTSTEAPANPPPPEERLGLDPPGETGDLLACDIVGAMTVYHNDGTSYFLVFTRDGGQFYAPDNGPNRARLSALVEIRILPKPGEGGKDLDGFLKGGRAAVDLSAALVSDENGDAWYVVTVGTDTKTFDASEANTAILDARGVFIAVKSPPRAGPKIT